MMENTVTEIVDIISQFIHCSSPGSARLLADIINEQEVEILLQISWTV